MGQRHDKRSSLSRLIAIAIWPVMAFALTAYGQSSEGSAGFPGSAQGSRKAPRCLPGPGATGAPRNIEELVVLINSLPKPVTIPCLIESLDRPLGVFATNSTTSLQLSTSPSDPRLFIFYLPLTISVTSDGPGAYLVEASVLQPGNKRSLKGELLFPVSENVASSRPYERIRKEAGTTCGFFCHGVEVRDPKISFAEAFISRAIRPSLSSEVSLDSLHRLKSECRPATNRSRCELLQALLAHGQVRRQDFPEEMPRGF